MLTQYLLVYHSPHIIVVLDYHHSDNNNNFAQYDCSINWPGNIYVFQIMYKEISGVPFVMVPGFNINKRDMELLWLKCTILCHCKSFWQIVNSKVSPFYSLSGKVVFYAIVLAILIMHHRTDMIRIIHSSNHMSVVLIKWLLC